MLLLCIVNAGGCFQCFHTRIHTHRQVIGAFTRDEAKLRQQKLMNIVEAQMRFARDYRQQHPLSRPHPTHPPVHPPQVSASPQTPRQAKARRLQARIAEQLDGDISSNGPGTVHKGYVGGLLLGTLNPYAAKAADSPPLSPPSASPAESGMQAPRKRQVSSSARARPVPRHLVVQAGTQPRLPIPPSPYVPKSVTRPRPSPAPIPALEAVFCLPRATLVSPAAHRRLRNQSSTVPPDILGGPLPALGPT